MPVYDIKLRRNDPDSEAHEITTATIGAATAEEAIEVLRKAANVMGHVDWDFSSMECAVREDMIMAEEEDQEDTPAPKRSWLCRLLGCK